MPKRFDLLFYSLSQVLTSSGAGSTDHQVSAALPLFSRSRFAKAPLEDFLNFLRQAVLLKQFHAFHNHFGQCVGYVVWTYLHADVERRLLRTGKLALADHEWNSGRSLWILDFSAQPSCLISILETLRDDLFCGDQQVTYARNKRDGLIFKRMDRHTPSAFWRQRSDRFAITGI